MPLICQVFRRDIIGHASVEVCALLQAAALRGHGAPGGAWTGMTAGINPLWQATVTAPAKTGKVTLEVRAKSPEGTDTHKLKILVGP